MINEFGLTFIEASDDRGNAVGGPDLQNAGMGPRGQDQDEQPAFPLYYRYTAISLPTFPDTVQAFSELACEPERAINFAERLPT